MSVEEYREAILTYMAEQHDVDIEDVDLDTPLFSSNIMDSFAMVELVAFIEDTARVKFDALDLHLNNLDSLEKMLAFITSKQG